MNVSSRAAAIGGLILAPAVGFVATVDPRLAIGSVVTIFAILALLYRRELLIYGLVIGALFNKVGVSIGFAILGPGDVVAVVAIGVWVIHRIARPDDRRLPRYWPLLAAWFAINTLSLLVNNGDARLYQPLLRMSIYILAAIVLIDFCRDEKRLRHVLWLMIFAGVIHAIFAIQMGGRRLSGLELTPNPLARVLAVCFLPAVAAYLWEKRVWVRVALLGSMTLVAVAIVMTQSRGTWFALALALGWWMRSYWRQAIALVLGALIVGGGAFMSLDDGTADMIEQRLELRDQSVSTRKDILQNGLRAIAAKPLLGAGYQRFTDIGDFVEVNAAYRKSAHNYYLTVAAESGVPNLLIFLTILWIAWRRISQRQRRGARAGPKARQRALTFAAVQAVFIYQVFDLLYKGATPMLLWMIIGLTIASGRVASSTSDEADETPEDPPEGAPEIQAIVLSNAPSISLARRARS